MLFENPVPLNMRLRMQPRSATVGKMAGIFTKRIWEPQLEAFYEVILLWRSCRTLHCVESDWVK